MLCQFCNHAMHQGPCFVLTNGIACPCVLGNPAGGDGPADVAPGPTCQFCSPHAVHNGQCGVLTSGVQCSCTTN